jgi:hypothetical protein
VVIKHPAVHNRPSARTARRAERLNADSYCRQALNHDDLGRRKAVEVGDGAGGGVGADILHVDHVVDVQLGNFHVERERIERVAGRPDQRAQERLPAAERLELAAGKKPKDGYSGEGFGPA